MSVVLVVCHNFIYLFLIGSVLAAVISVNNYMSRAQCIHTACVYGEKYIHLICYDP